jgi:very-short-patch-repair endonuclease
MTSIKICTSNKKLCKDNECKICFNKSFASNEKSEFWHNTKNKNITPRQVFKGSPSKYWFKCNICFHSFNTSLNDVNSGYWCPYCASPSRKLCNSNECKLCFNKSFASHEKSIYWSNKNKNIIPRNVFKISGKKYWFNCNICDHNFDNSLANIVRLNSWCPYCALPSRKLCNDNECKLCFNKSFASHEKSIYWSNKNKNIIPRNVFKVSGKKYYFNCNKCNHNFNIQLSNIKNNNWCPYCSNKTLCNNNDCKICYDKSFASSEKSIYWSSINKNITPRQIFKQSNKKYYFNCNNCNHNFNIRLYSIKNNNWCSYCSNTFLCINDKCKICFNKSFASSEKSIYWSDKNENIKPRQVFKQSNKKYYFKCDICNNCFKIRLNHVYQGKWCNICKNKTEHILYKTLKLNYPTIQTQFKQKWCKKKLYLPFDFCIPELKIIIELDGPQHFKQISNWCSPILQFENDKYKEKCANNNYYSTIRILQKDIYYNNYDWSKELFDTIEEIKKNKNIINYYLCKKNEYFKY